IAFGVNLSNSIAYIGDNQLPTFGDASDMQAAIDRQRSDGDDGCTPYLNALSLAKTAIIQDLEDHPEEDSVYNVFFMSDGAPNDTKPNSDPSTQCGDVTPVQDSPADPYIMAVKDLVRTAPEQVFFSTAYYTLPENDPGRRNGEGLKAMAKYGNGKFVDLEANDELDFDELLLGPRPESWILKRMVAFNFNAANCNDGSRDADSDADGICDKDEIAYNQLFTERLSELNREFDPLNRNSIDPNYSDLFALRFLVMPLAEGLKSCSDPRPDEDHDLLNSCEENMLFDNQANGPTKQWTDQLQGMGSGTASSKNPDSDGDGFLDVIEFFTFGLKSSAVNYTNIFNRYAGGITGETILAEHRHPMAPEELSRANTDLRVTYAGFNEEGENCYSVDLNNIALYNTQAVEREDLSQLKELEHQSSQNVILVYFIMTQERDPNGKGYLMYKYHTVNYPQGLSRSLDFDDFEAYKIRNNQY
ncbi:MAG: hypothetical protein KDD35_06435, partial [Bdellovibrionales bacterium]|nr:hypothetical protein [Bdellovibrionales bacterium]